MKLTSIFSAAVLLATLGAAQRAADAETICEQVTEWHGDQIERLKIASSEAGYLIGWTTGAGSASRVEHIRVFDRSWRPVASHQEAASDVFFVAGTDNFLRAHVGSYGIWVWQYDLANQRTPRTRLADGRIVSGDVSFDGEAYVAAWLRRDNNRRFLEIKRFTSAGLLDGGPDHVIEIDDPRADTVMTARVGAVTWIVWSDGRDIAGVRHRTSDGVILDAEPLELGEGALVGFASRAERGLLVSHQLALVDDQGAVTITGGGSFTESFVGGPRGYLSAHAGGVTFPAIGNTRIWALNVDASGLRNVDLPVSEIATTFDGSALVAAVSDDTVDSPAAASRSVYVRVLDADDQLRPIDGNRSPLATVNLTSSTRTECYDSDAPNGGDPPPWLEDEDFEGTHCSAGGPRGMAPVVLVAMLLLMRRRGVRG